jgi:hypothetical protein
MSPLDVSHLRQTRPLAPPELRDRVRAIAAARSAPPRRITWRRAALVVAAAVLAVAAAAVVRGRADGETATRDQSYATSGAAIEKAPPAARTLGAPSALDSAIAPAPSGSRLQDYDATLRLRVGDADALSDATKRAVRIAGSLGGFASVVRVDVDGDEGDATLRLRVPVTKVQQALEQLSALGTITGESVSIQDVQPAVNAIDARIARLQRQLRDLRAQPPTPETERRIDRLTEQVQRLQRAKAGTVRQVRLATISLDLTTRTPAPAPRPDDSGPLDGALAALGWIGVGVLYAVVVGGPIALVLLVAWLVWRTVRRRSERRLLEHA